LVENALRKRFGKLSPELWRIVSDDDGLIRLYTIAEMSLLRKETGSSIDPSASVWVKSVNFDGVEYVSSISNSPIAGSRQAWESTSSDYLGIRQVIADPSRVKSNASYSEHWKTVRINGEMLSFTGDVSAEPNMERVYTKLK
jgi:hypothetical protein